MTKISSLWNTWEEKLMYTLETHLVEEEKSKPFFRVHISSEDYLKAKQRLFQALYKHSCSQPLSSLPQEKEHQGKVELQSKMNTMMRHKNMNFLMLF